MGKFNQKNFDILGFHLFQLQKLNTKTRRHVIQSITNGYLITRKDLFCRSLQENETYASKGKLQTEAESNKMKRY